ncbi:MAG: hypothetical protein ACFFA0_00720 [Promethearchaeota archaeon]
MKKSRILLVSLLGLFLFVPLTNYSTAVPPAYIGVQVGESYTWTIGVNVDGYSAMIVDMGGTVPPEVSMFETMPSIQMRGDIEYISDEYSGVVYDYVLINISIYMNVPGYGWMPYFPPGEHLPIFVLNKDTPNYFNSTVNAMNLETLPPLYSFAFPFLIVPYNLNWTQAASELNALVDQLTGGVTGLVIEEYGNGFTLTIPAQNIEGNDLAEMKFTAQWNSKGVFGAGEMKYDGTTVMTVNAPDSGIPGFDVVILIGVVGVSTLGVIYFVKKKN